jgi:hypothetical protein
MIVSLPSMAFVPLLVWATEGNRTKSKRILYIPILIGTFLFGTLVPILFYSAGIFAITDYFMRAASHQMVYAIVGGLLCFWIRAPSGETNVLGILVSVVSYILYMTILKTLGQNVSDMGFTIVKLILAILFPVLILGLIITFLSWVVSKLKGVKNV